MELSTILKDLVMEAAPELSIDEGRGRVRCVACAHRCLIGDGKEGVCRVRFNEGGTIKAPAGYVAGLAVDPIEKKPFYHAFPGRDALSFGMLGCDFHCSYCQNWVSSQTLRDSHATAGPVRVDPERIVAAGVDHGVPVIVSTYNEPLITADWATQIFKSAKEARITCGFVSNGYATPEVIEYIRPYVDLYKVDLKSFEDRDYRRLGGTLKAVLNTIALLHEKGFWVEVVTLVVPGFNDSDDEITKMASFIASVSPDIPWHVTAFRPDYKMNDRPRTRAESLVRVCEIGKAAGLRYVYPGNAAGGVGDLENTRCHACNETLIKRRGFIVEDNRMKGNSCPDCNAIIPGVWERHPPRRTTGPGMPIRVCV